MRRWNWSLNSHPISIPFVYSRSISGPFLCHCALSFENIDAPLHSDHPFWDVDSPSTVSSLGTPGRTKSPSVTRAISQLCKSLVYPIISFLNRSLNFVPVVCPFLSIIVPHFTLQPSPPGSAPPGVSTPPGSAPLPPKATLFWTRGGGGGKINPLTYPDGK